MERWKEIPWTKGMYQVSNLGQIKSMPRQIVRKNGIKLTIPGKIMTPTIGNQYGHLYVSIRVEGKHFYKTVHKLVAEAFLGPCPKGKECLHGKGGKQDNRVSNIRYGTRKENHADMQKFGNPNYRGSPKLTEDDLKKISKHRKRGLSYRKIGKIMGYDNSTINRAHRGVTHKAMKGDGDE